MNFCRCFFLSLGQNSYGISDPDQEHVLGLREGCGPLLPSVKPFCPRTALSSQLCIYNSVNFMANAAPIIFLKFIGTS
jgi:hypothetical protein